MNWAVFSMVFTIASGTTIGILLAAALVLGYGQISQVITVCLTGFILSLPITWILTKKIQKLGMNSQNDHQKM